MKKLLFLVLLITSIPSLSLVHDTIHDEQSFSRGYDTNITSLSESYLFLTGNDKDFKEKDCNDAAVSFIENNRERCLYNAKCDCYKKCYHVTASGKCIHWGAPC